VFFPKKNSREGIFRGSLLSVVTTEEFGEVVNAIVEAVKHPDRRILCQRLTWRKLKQS